ncbi:ATP-binding protein [Sphingomonas paeninsulae]|nr:AAA family ATPase [Sphingomonas paeninsulae]
MATRQPFTEKYRPTRFEDLHGQDKVVAMLRRHVETNNLSALLAAGPPGTGKTTAMRVFSQALQCHAPTPSPCGKCASCVSFNENKHQYVHYEFSAANHGELSTAAMIASFSGFHMNRRLGIFADEVQGFGPSASDALLQVTERPTGDTYYLFATSEPEKVRPALRSRLLTLEFNLLTPAASMKVLKDICLREDITYDLDALEMLVSAGKGSAREIVKLLDNISQQGHVNTSLVSDTLLFGWASAIVEYCYALLEGDVEAQEFALSRWLVPPQQKATGIRDFLLYLFNFEIARPARSAIVNAAFHTVSAEQRRRIIAGFRPRASRAKMSLETYWRLMMKHWNFDHARVIDDANLSVRLIIFDNLINGDFDELPQPNEAKVIVPSDRRYRIRSQNLPVTRVAISSHDPSGAMTFSQAGTIYDAASFLPQQYGVLFNARFRIRHPGHGPAALDSAKKSVSQFVHELGIFSSRRDPTNKAHWIYAHEQPGGIVYTEVVAHLPLAAVDLIDDWLTERRKAWFGEDSLYDRSWEIEVAKPGTAKAHVAKHWRMVRNLWRTLDQMRGWKLPNGRLVSVIALLAVPKGIWATSDNMDGTRRLGTSGSIGADVRRAAGSLTMPLLSALADGAWDYIDSGWELHEFQDRRNEIASRKRDEDMILAKWPASDDALQDRPRREAITRLHASWPRDPKDRRRDWEGWWG